MNIKELNIIAAREAVIKLVPNQKTKREKLVEMALSQVGTVEYTGNQVKYNYWMYGRQVKDGDRPGAFYPWCMAFVCWCFAQVGKKLPRADYNNGWTSVPNFYQYALNHNMITDDPKPGDIVIYSWGGKITHVGFFLNWEFNEKKERIYHRSVEGNTSFDENGSQDNGGCVAIKKRNNKLVKVFVKSDYFLQ